jgi:hypothetical protein
MHATIVTGLGLRHPNRMNYGSSHKPYLLLYVSDLLCEWRCALNVALLLLLLLLGAHGCSTLLGIIQQLNCKLQQQHSSACSRLTHPCCFAAATAAGSAAVILRRKRRLDPAFGPAAVSLSTAACAVCLQHSAGSVSKGPCHGQAGTECLLVFQDSLLQQLLHQAGQVGPHCLQEHMKRMTTVGWQLAYLPCVCM